MIRCDRCGTEYHDEGSIAVAMCAEDDWAKMCRADGVEPRGLHPCPNFTCDGEMVEA